MRRVISLLVENKAGVLSRVVGLFSQRGYNIESLNVAPALEGASRITLTTITDDAGTEQVVKQLSKLINVVKVTLYDPASHVLREMALVRIQVTEDNRTEVLALSEVFRARVIDVRPTSYIFEVTGQADKIDAFLQNAQVYGVRELHRTGELTLSRGKAGKKESSSARKKPALVNDPDQENPPKSEVKAKHG
ncbi:MAG: acetolactate synthase small subunit [Acidobacteria bacterium]|nr:acetolactate synthase small subunit [Acidobacteriota bacterium]TDI15611.1 MAG: acetolactate synthase small subunit [Acidobacteriota bacterium]